MTEMPGLTGTRGCPGCGRPMRVHARFCPGCGSPAGPSAGDPVHTVPEVARPQIYSGDPYGTDPYDVGPSGRAASPGRRLLVPLLVMTLVLAVAGAASAAVLLGQRSGAAADGPAGRGQAAVQPSDSGLGSVPVADGSTVPSPPDAGSVLLETVAADRSTAEQLTGYWLPQVSSKMIGSDGYDGAGVLADHRAQRATHPGTAFVLVRSADYSTFTLDGYWVTLAAVPFTDAGQANAWCDEEGYPPDECFAKRLSHTDGPAGNTVHR